MKLQNKTQPVAKDSFDREAVKGPKDQPLDTLRLLLEQHQLTAADLSRLLGSDRSLGAKILRNERRLALDHIRVLARHFNVEPGLFC